MNRIRQLREELGWKQDDLAKRLRVERAAVSKYENENIPLTADKILLLCTIFNVSADYLLCNTEIKATLSGQPLSQSMGSLVKESSDLSEDELKSVLEYVDFLKLKRKP